MRPTNDICPACERKIKVLRAPEFAGKRYCCSDCSIDAWEAAEAKAVSRKLASNIAADTFGKGTSK
tara:strand:+ start:148 stop:345 length:198 start_codon:yes stop_codon:yes gene_type:complete